MRTPRHVFAMAVMCLLARSALANVTLSGWVGAQVTADTLPGTKVGLDVHPWYFIVEAEPVEDLRVFGELELEHLVQFVAGKAGAGQFFVERLYIEKVISTEANLRLGKTFTPFGYWYRLHWQFLLDNATRPLSMDNAYVPRSQVGAQYWGRWYRGSTEVAYYAWLSNGPDVVGTDKRTVFEPGFGASLFVTHALGGNEETTLGAAASYHTQWVATPSGALRQDNAVVGLEAKVYRLDLRAEGYWHHTSDGRYRNTFYGLGTFWVVPTVGATYRFDWGADAKRTAGATSELARAHVFGVVWRPAAALVAKVEVRVNQFQDQAVASYLQATAAIAVKY